MHRDDEQVQRYLHGELTAAEAEMMRDHLRACAECRMRLVAAAEEEEMVDRLLRQLDHAPPQLAAEAVAARSRVRGSHSLRWAAAVLVALGTAGAAYAAVGSPLSAWVGAWFDRVGASPEAAPSPSGIDPATAEPPSGIAVAPGEDLLVVFSTAQPTGAARVVLTDGPNVEVRSSIGSGIFSSELDSLVIDNTGSSAAFEIDIPRAAPRVEIRVAGRPVLLKQGSTITSDSATDSAGVYHLPLTHPRP
jgi:hypothetical protein